MPRVRWIVLIAALSALTGGCASSQRPQIRSVHPRVTGLDPRGIDMVFDLDISNPYPLALRAPKFDYFLDIQGGEFLRSQNPVEVDLPGGRGGIVSLPVRVDYGEILRTFRGLRDESEFQYQIRGEFTVAMLGTDTVIQLAHRGTAPIFRPPIISIGQIRVGEISLNRAEVIAEATLQNPNGFELGLGALGCALRLGQTPVGALTASADRAIAAHAGGKVRLTGEITSSAALMKLLQGSSLGAAVLTLNGTVQTPYGPAPARGL